MSGHSVNKWQDGRCLMPEDPVGFILDQLLRSGAYGDPLTDEAGVRRAMRDLGEGQHGSCGPADPVIEWRSATSPRVEVACDFYVLGPEHCQRHQTVTAAQILARFRRRQVGEQLELFEVAS